MMSIFIVKYLFYFELGLTGGAVFNNIFFQIAIAMVVPGNRETFRPPDINFFFVCTFKPL